MNDIVLDWAPANTTAPMIQQLQRKIRENNNLKAQYEVTIELRETAIATINRYKTRNIQRMVAKYGDLIQLITGQNIHRFTPASLAAKLADLTSDLTYNTRQYGIVVANLDRLNKELRELEQKAATSEENRPITVDDLRALEQTYGVHSLTLTTSADKTQLNALEFVIENPHIIMDWKWKHAPVNKGRFHVNYAIKVRFHSGNIHLQFHGDRPNPDTSPIRHAEWGRGAHPHVMSDTSGRVCMGTFDQLIQSSLTTRSLDALITVCLQYVHMTNAAGGGDHGGLHAHLWLHHAMPEGVERTLLYETPTKSPDETDRPAPEKVKIYGIKGYRKDADGNIRVNDDITYKFTIPRDRQIPDDAPKDNYTVIPAGETTWKNRGL